MGGPSETTLYILVSLTANDGENFGDIVCLTENSGAFDIPGDLVDQLPSGEASVSVRQPIERFEEADGRWIQFVGEVGAYAFGNRP